MASHAPAPRCNVETAESTLHHRIATLNRQRLVPGAGEDWRARIELETLVRMLECRYVENARARVREQAETAPSAPDAFVDWFAQLEASGPGQHDLLFDYLAQEADLEQMRWFLAQEVAGEAGFDDSVALTQVRLPEVAKLELARNYWDEMGRGKASGMHGPMLATLARELEVDGWPLDAVVWQSLALANLMLALAANRGYAYQSIGALGVVELTAPGRAAKVNAGLERLGVGGRARQYFALHATLDRQHSRQWNDQVLRPLVAEEPARARALAEGALMRLDAGARCFARYRRELGLAANDDVAERRSV